MNGMRDWRLWAAFAGATAAGIAAAHAERHHLRTIAEDPEDTFLRELPSGTPLTVRSADGTQLHAETFGPQDGQTLVLAHGWTEMLGYWSYVIRDLSDRGLRLVAYDLRGHGRSEAGSGGDYSIARFGEDLEAVLAASVPEGRRAVVVGHSLGAMSIAAWAEHHDVERRISGAALLNTGVGDLLAEHLLVPVPAIAQLLNKTLGPLGLGGVRTKLPRFSTPLSHRLIRYTAFGPSATPAQVAFYERMLVSVPPDVRADVAIALSELELHHALPRLTVPTIVIAGELDKLTPPSHAHRIAESLPRLEQVIVLPGVAHMGPLERPREISEALARIAAVAGRSETAAVA